jgi:hypothetical protein
LLTMLHLMILPLVARRFGPVRGPLSAPRGGAPPARP